MQQVLNHDAVRREYGLGDDLPRWIDMGTPFKPTHPTEWSWTMQTTNLGGWNRIEARRRVWSDPAGGPGYWVDLPGEQVKLVVVNTSGTTVRHPVLDGLVFPDAAAAYEAAWDEGLLKLRMHPPMNLRR
jgi:hypothetical protein